MTTQPIETEERVRAPRSALAHSRGSIALAHHWMEFFRGGEAVLDEFGRIFPAAPIHIMVYNPKLLPASLLAHPIHPSALQHVPWLRSRFRNLLPFFPEVIRSMRIASTTRFVLSSDASLIKGVTLPDGAIHVCYCHSPPRYLWGLESSYLESSSHGNRIGRWLFSAALPRLRRFDRRMAGRVDRFIANSRYVQERISRHYGRPSVVIHPPVDVDRFDPNRPREDFYLVVSALVPYKRVDLAVEACTRLGRRLVVIGTGPEEADLKRRAHAHVTFLGWQPTEVVRDHFERCRALLFPGIEDFGITPCEAQAAGAPVIAFAEGGALETVREGTTGLFFTEQSTDSLIECIKRFELSGDFSAAACRANVDHLRPARFRREIRMYLESEFPDFFAGHSWPEDEFNAGHSARVVDVSAGLIRGVPAGVPASEVGERVGRQRVASIIAGSRERTGGFGSEARRRVRSLLAFPAIIAGGGCAIYLSFRSTGELATVPWLPEAVGNWADQHGRFRNLPAYFLLAIPVLLAMQTPASRLRAVGLVGVFGTVLELAEIFVPRRMVEWQDIAWTWAGAIAAWLILETIRRLIEKSGALLACHRPS